jgi:hypothetical protein
MKVTMLLADAAQAVNGKLYILGGGWSLTGPQPTPLALAIKIEVPWTQANTQHHLRVALFDEDEHPVLIPTPNGDLPCELQSPFEVGRPAGLKTGSPLDVTLAMNLAPLPLQPNTRYIWRCFIDNAPVQEVGFSTRPLPQAPPPPVPHP